MDDVVTFEIAKKLKEKGFREKCLCRYYKYSKTLHINEVEPKIARKIDYSEFFKCYNSCVDSDIDAPTISQALDWLREEKGIHVGIVVWERGWYYDAFSFEYNEEELEYETNGRCVSKNYKSYKEAALAGIDYVLDELI